MQKKETDFEFIERVKPEWAKAIVIAELIENDSDVMRDYFSYFVVKRVLLGFSKSKRNNFSELRKFAALFGPTKALADHGEERRDEYYYLSEPGKYYPYNGWKVRKECFDFYADCTFYKRHLMK